MSRYVPSFLAFGRRLTGAIGLFLFAALPCCVIREGYGDTGCFAEHQSVVTLPAATRGLDCVATLAHGAHHVSYSFPADPSFVPPPGTGPSNEQPPARGDIACAAIDGPRATSCVRSSDSLQLSAFGADIGALERALDVQSVERDAVTLTVQCGTVLVTREQPSPMCVHPI